MKPDIVDFDAFASKYMAKSDQPFLPGNSPIQVYPLHLATTFINAPLHYSGLIIILYYYFHQVVESSR